MIALLRALAGSGADLAHSTARMAASEARIVLHRATRRAGLFLAGLLVAAAGLLLALAGAALLLARSAGMEEWLAFLLVGTAALAVGAAFAFRAARLLSAPDLAFPATLAEFQADVERLRGGNGAAGEEGK